MSVFRCRVLTPGLSPSRERPVPQRAPGSLPCPTLSSGTPRAVAPGFSASLETRSRMLDLFEVTRHSLVSSGLPSRVSPMCCPLPQRRPKATLLRREDSIFPARSALVVSHHLGGLLRDPHVPKTVPTALRRALRGASEDASRRRPHTRRTEVRQLLISRAHRVGLVASRLPSWGSLHFTPRAGLPRHESAFVSSPLSG